jgi:DNA-directed RNA polymerase sigma subunit (sigma70/sigma32)
MVAIRRTADLLERELGRRPTAIEVQARLPTKARRYSVENNLRVVAGVSREVELTEASTASFAETDTIDESDIVNAIDRRRQIDTMSMALAGLTVRQQQMLSMLYGLDGAELDNDAELARAIGRSRQVVNFHKKRAIKMLRRRMVVEGSAVGAKK